MGRNPWDDDADMQALRGGRSSTRWGRVFWGLVLVGMATFAVAYYLPLFRAHDTLTAEHVKVLKDLQTQKQTLESQNAELKRVSARKEELEIAQQKVASGDAAASTALDGVKSQLASKLDRLSKKNLAEVGVAEGRLVVGVADAGIFNPRKLELSPSAKPWLCELANAAGNQPLRIRALDDNAPPSGPLATGYSTIWPLRAARGAVVAEALEGLCSVAGTRIEVQGVGGSARPNSALPGSKLPASRIEIEFGVRAK